MNVHALNIRLMAGAALLAALPAFAAPVEVPQGCSAFLTVQSKGCAVSHYWRCEAAPDGTVWEARYNVDGLYSLSVYDHDFQWLDSQYFADGTREQLVGAGPDPASLTNLLETGRDTYAFVIRETRGDTEREVVHQGHDELTGNRVTIDGVELLETEFSSTAMDAVSGEEIFSVRGNQYVLEEERLFFLGPDTFRTSGEDQESDLSPVNFMRPGEPGFGETTPHYECNASTDIGFTPTPPTAQTGEKRNDDL